MDELTKGMQDELPWCMLLADDIVIIDEARDGVNGKLEWWRHTLESRGFQVNRSKTKYLHYCFNGREDARGEVKIDWMMIPKVEKFKYLGSIIQQKWDIDEDINQRIKAG